MRIFTTAAAIGFAMIYAASAQAAPASPFRLPLKGHAHVAKKSLSDLKKTAINCDVWKPTVEKVYGWQRKKWTLEDTYVKTYDFSGNCVKEENSTADGEIIVTDCSYNANNKVIFRESKVSFDGQNFDNSMRSEFQYDPLLTNLITMRIEWMWMNNDWQLVGNNYKRDITRDEKGNITSVVISTLFQGYYDPIERLEVTYGEDGKADYIHVTNLAYDGSKYYWIDNTTVKDIVWENTNGQIADAENLFIGANRIKSAVFIAHEEEITMTWKVEYRPGSDWYEATVLADQDGVEVEGHVLYEPLENDGYRSTSTSKYPGEEELVDFEEVNYDSWGNLIKSYYEWREGDSTGIEEDIKGVVEYDDQGVPQSYEMLQTYYDNPDNPVTENVFRSEFFDYVDVTAGVSCNPVGEDTPVEYFNLQGQKISRPLPGTVCIRRQGASSSKILVK